MLELYQTHLGFRFLRACCAATLKRLFPRKTSKGLGHSSAFRKNKRFNLLPFKPLKNENPGAFGIVRQGNRGLAILLGIVAVSLLSACQSMQQSLSAPTSPAPNPTAVGIATGVFVAGTVAATATTGPAVPLSILGGGYAGGVIGQFVQNKQTVLLKLQQQGANVIRVGNQLSIVLPADRVFFHYSPLVQPDFYPVLRTLTQYVNQFPNTSVEVDGYTDDKGAWDRNRSLSQTRAENVADFLWTTGIKTRMIYAVGFGAGNPIASNKTTEGRAQNRRIVVQLRVLQT